MAPTRASFLLFLRKAHAWVGLSGAVFGLLFGISGFLQNHRAVMKIEAGHSEERQVTMELPEAPATIDALAQVLAQRMNWDASRLRTRVQAPRAARIGGAAVTAAARWIIDYPGHRHSARAIGSPGNRTVEVQMEDSGFLDTLSNLHKAEAGQRGWILLADAFAGALVFMSLSGILLWTKLSGPKLLAMGLSLSSLITAALVASRSW
ncbi:MAG TPA: PepSY-associated TM helix domain-containing protein [Holophagaceae bacterium]|nr:PepSY-associated TM helix domain-containing protein [Holophagaceae bacterium]